MSLSGEEVRALQGVIDRLLRASECAEAMSISPRTWLRWVADGKAPQPVIKERRMTRWAMSDFNNFVEFLKMRGGEVDAQRV